MTTTPLAARLDRLTQTVARYRAGYLPADLLPALVGELRVCARLLAAANVQGAAASPPAHGHTRRVGKES